MRKFYFLIQLSSGGITICVLIGIIRKELIINTSLYTLLQKLSVSVFEKSDISWAFQPGRQIENNEDDPKKLILLGFYLESNEI